MQADFKGYIFPSSGTINIYRKNLIIRLKYYLHIIALIKYYNNFYKAFIRTCLHLW